MEPVPDVHALSLHLKRLQFTGFTLVPQALAPTHLARVRERLDELFRDHANVPTAVEDFRRTSLAGSGSIDINRLFELDPVFEDLMDRPTVLPIIQASLGYDATLCCDATGNFRASRSRAATLWHRDGGPYLRLTYFLDDIAEHNGATAFLPGSHLSSEPPPPWANHNGQPRRLPGMVYATGPAGACLLNNTNLWHTNTPNESNQPRRVIWLLFKPSQVEFASHDEMKSTAAYIASQADPRRRALMGLTD